MANRNLRRIPIWLVAVGDLAVLNLALVAVFYFRFGGVPPATNMEALLATLPWACLTAILLFAGLGLYERHLSGFMPVMRALVPAIFGVGLATAAIAFWVRGFAFPRSVLLLGLFAQFTGVLLWRGICWYLDRLVHGRRELLFVGLLETTRPVLEKLLDLPQGLIHIRAVLKPGDVAALKQDLPMVDGVVVGPGVPHEHKAKVVALCLDLGREVYLVPELYEVMLTGARVEQLDDLPVLQVEDVRLSALQTVIKRAVDITAALLILVVLSPLFALAVFAVRFSSRGAVFYVQERVGYRGRVFRLLKLRTMVENAEEETGPTLAQADDRRVTQVGKVLRATRIDELPQLFNVLKGEMSLVGPRPERPVFVDEFTLVHQAYRYRHLVKPGLTGLAQVYGRYTTSPEDKLRYDLYYIRNYSLLLDLKILLRTVPVALSPSSARGSGEGRDKTAAILALVNATREEAAAGKDG
ncbi:MAG: sugar transferase [Ammonifex sp.]|jgi:exopolysaccharide biosynthesis polyprenyl glycosylphosphotransferase|nr:MAG: sugar transferase [Ammonifex sp.]